ncbi:MAG: hypothetical protein WDN50_12740 [Bradyrhizobium sp.]
MRHSAGHQIPGVEIVDRPGLDSHALCRDQLRLDCGSDARSYLVLQREDIGEIAVVALSPDVISRHRIHELAGNTHTLPAFAYTAFQQIADTEIAAHLLYIRRLALVDKRRIPGDDEEPA